MPDLTRRLFLQLSIVGAVSRSQPQPDARTPLEALWLQRAEVIQQREQSMASVCDDELGDALWVLFDQQLDDIERQIRHLPPDQDTIAAQFLICSENYSLKSATEIGSPRESLRWIADAYLRAFRPNLSSALFR